MRRTVPMLLILCCTACAEQPQVSSYEQDRQHCVSRMYAERATRGRSAPNWLGYDYCMRSRGHPSG